MKNRRRFVPSVDQFERIIALDGADGEVPDNVPADGGYVDPTDPGDDGSGACDNPQPIIAPPIPPLVITIAPDPDFVGPPNPYPAPLPPGSGEGGMPIGPSPIGPVGGAGGTPPAEAPPVLILPPDTDGDGIFDEDDEYPDNPDQFTGDDDTNGNGVEDPGEGPDS